MARPWWQDHWHWTFAVLVGAWAAFFLVPAPSPWAWLTPLFAMLGAWMLRARPVVGSALILAGSVISSVAGVAYGQIETVLPTMAALYCLARTRTPIVVGLIFVAAFATVTGTREGAGLGAIPTGLIVYGLPWAFGKIVSQRAFTATRAVKEAERLGAIDVARVANGAAAKERQRVIDEAISTLRTALAQILTRATAAIDDPTDACIRSIQDASRTAIDRLHHALGALRGVPEVLRQGPSSTANEAQREATASGTSPGKLTRGIGTVWYRRRSFAVVVAALAVVLMLVAAEFVGSSWLRPVSLVPALLIPAAALVAPRIPLVASVAAAGALLVALLDSPHPPEALMPVALPLAVLCWRFGQSDFGHRGWGVGIVAVASIVLSLQHGREGVGYVLTLLTLGLFGGVAWAQKDAVMHREEARAAKFTARLAAAEIGAIREERRRIARELHDVVSHAVASVSLQAQVARIHREAKPAESRLALETVLAIAEMTSCELETIADRLHRAESKLDLQQLVEQGCNLGLRISADLDDNAIDDELAYRIVQESLTNAARYAPGSAVDVSVSTRDLRRWVVVRNGAAVCESDAAPGVVPRGSGSGLLGLAERVSEASGQFSYGPVDDGFEVLADWPLRGVEVNPAHPIPSMQEEQA